MWNKWNNSFWTALIDESEEWSSQWIFQRTGNAEVTGSNPVEALIFFQASSFQLLKLENSLQGSFFTLKISCPRKKKSSWHMTIGNIAEVTIWGNPLYVLSLLKQVDFQLQFYRMILIFFLSLFQVVYMGWIWERMKSTNHWNIWKRKFLTLKGPELQIFNMPPVSTCEAYWFGPGCLKLGWNNLGLVRNLNSDTRA